MACSHDIRGEYCRMGTTPLYRCASCGLIFTDRYGKDYDAKHVYRNFYNEMSGRFGFGLEHLIRLFRFFRAFKIFTLSPRAGRILDVGSGRGFMLYYLRKYYRYRRAAGTQVARHAVEFSRGVLGLEIYDRDLLEIDFGPGAFDIVTMWHVLEHVTKPERYIEKLHTALDDRGRLVIEVPNYDSWTRALTGKYWLGLDLEHHITFFTPRSLTALLEENCFTVKKIRTFSLEYSTFLSAQSLVSALTRTDQVFFRSIQTGGLDRRFIVHGFLFAVLTPLCFLVNLLLYFSKKGEVLLIIAEKTTAPEPVRKETIR